MTQAKKEAELKDAYEILGLTRDSSEQELKARYEELRAKYSEERFLPGDTGNEGARKLMELEDAWIIIFADLEKIRIAREFGGDFGQIESLIKEGKYDEAQRIMDEVKVRTAEWHYYQSIIYYKREWLRESRAQLAMAVSMDPNNAKYSEALNRLDSLMANPKADQTAFDGAGRGTAYRQDAGAADSLCRCCQIYCCLECLCQICCSCR